MSAPLKKSSPLHRGPTPKELRPWQQYQIRPGTRFITTPTTATLYGTAELLNGSGYLFRAEGERSATLVSYKDPELMLLGLVDLARCRQMSIPAGRWRGRIAHPQSTGGGVT